MGTFADLQNNLKALGFKAQSLDCKISVFVSEGLVAYIYYIGNGQGFEASVYEVEPRSKDEVKEIDGLITLLKEVKSATISRNKKSQKAFELTKNGSYKQASKSSADLNWECMNLEKVKIDFARAFKGSVVDVSTEEALFSPSGFHQYKH